MPRLQQIKRANGTVVHSINLPLLLIERMEWKKGDEIYVGIGKVNGEKCFVLMQKK